MLELMNNKTQIPDFSANKNWKDNREDDENEAFARYQEEAEVESSYIQYLETLIN